MKTKQNLKAVSTEAAFFLDFGKNEKNVFLAAIFLQS